MESTAETKDSICSYVDLTTHRQLISTVHPEEHNNRHSSSKGAAEGPPLSICCPVKRLTLRDGCIAHVQQQGLEGGRGLRRNSWDLISSMASLTLSACDFVLPWPSSWIFLYSWCDALQNADCSVLPLKTWHTYSHVTVTPVRFAYPSPVVSASIQMWTGRDKGHVKGPWPLTTKSQGTTKALE